jgi:hypothetical protein
MATRTMYQVRTFNGSEYSRPVGFKTRLVERTQAQRIVKRLKRAGLAAYAAQIKVAA